MSMTGAGRATPGGQEPARRHVIVGAGLAGHRAVLELRRLDPSASITLIGEEAGLPYDRPPLSKDLLLGRMAPDALSLPGTADYATLNILHSAGQRVVAIDRAARQVATARGEAIPYDRLLLATGSRPLVLPAEAGAPVHTLRGLDDAARLRAGMVPGRHVAVVGGGFIGLEVAAAARMLGCRVTVVEAAPRLLVRGMPEALSRWAAALHGREGVALRLGARVAAIRAAPEGGAVLDLGGEALRADLVVVGIGIRPNTELAEAAGLAVGDGILVDAACGTDDPAIFAAGEVTCHPIAGQGPRRRVESWKTASEQPLTAARAMCGEAACYEDLPWLWSDQFTHNIQSVGLPDSGVEFVERGDPGSDRWTLVSMDEEGRPVGAVAVNNGRDIGMLRKAIRAGQPVPRAVLADPAARLAVPARAAAG
ncbi:NAD(P)/FAD-dependent oxidoreductase [Roseomonas xinghualingensis]|uniref:NAD(P)/FAD-dependent oxidoreductase n=1 Tax=Roseomonas xinghualingensis TaxID=2986475 RepID=UPI0021F24198|nr:FAD-dependent oxidoreductase [Roseomonas sp. SXEYE001]MCV4209734.1 FAD-dependent oxidoreductase [Roseomonas sp. SXEYE001]